MNWDIVEGNWKQLTGKAREKWGKLTDSDFEQIAGKKDQLIGRIQERYGITKEEAQKRRRMSGFACSRSKNSTQRTRLNDRLTAVGSRNSGRPCGRPFLV
jgi:uncharacterized protein YjbJ (UPF0337 family)